MVPPNPIYLTSKKANFSQVFSSEFYKFSKNIFSTEHLRTTASDFKLNKPKLLYCQKCFDIIFLSFEILFKGVVLIFKICEKDRVRIVNTLLKEKLQVTVIQLASLRKRNFCYSLFSENFLSNCSSVTVAGSERLEIFSIKDQENI